MSMRVAYAKHAMCRARDEEKASESDILCPAVTEVLSILRGLYSPIAYYLPSYSSITINIALC